MAYLIIIAAIVIVLAAVFARKHDDSHSDYVEPTFRHSGKKWVFNGILDIDAPPEQNEIFVDYDGEYQLMTKKGFVHYDLVLYENAKHHLGMFQASAIASNDGKIDIIVDNQAIASLPKGTSELHKKISNKGGKAKAYGFIASRNNELFGEVCVC